MATTIGLHYRPAGADDCDAMATLLRQASQEFITGQFTADAAQRFLDGNRADQLRSQLDERGFFYVATDGNLMAGMIGVVATTHIKYLFVGGAWHRRGVARRLLALAIEQMQRRGPVTAVSLNASDYGLRAYERLGFVAVEPRQERAGVWFTPMRLTLETAV